MLRHTVTTGFDAGVDLRDVQIAARHADPRTTMRHDRARREPRPPPWHRSSSSSAPSKHGTVPVPVPAKVPVQAQGPPLLSGQSRVSPPEGPLSRWDRVVHHVIIPASVASLLGATAALLAIALTIVISPVGATQPTGQPTGQPTHPPTTQSPSGTPPSNAPVPARAVKVSAARGTQGPDSGMTLP